MQRNNGLSRDSNVNGGLSRYLPALGWFSTYRRHDLAGDMMAGVIVAIMLVPQSMAYAGIAGLPPQTGLYASILPLVVYGLLGTSRALAVGPVAIVSLLVATAIGPLASPGSPLYLQLALTLALLAGLIQLLLGVVRLGFLTNFLSHPVISGFTSAAALIIAFSQIKTLLGIPVPSSGSLAGQAIDLVGHLPAANPATMVIGLGAVAVLLLFRYRLATAVGRRLPQWLAVPIARSGPLVVVILGTGLVARLGLDAHAGVAILGQVPAGLPPLTMPVFDPARWLALLPAALTISLVGYVESISMARTLASKRRQKIDANQELIALGAADLAAALSAGHPVTGGLSRSSVNFAAGANTGLASIITAILIALTVLFLTPLFFFMPRAVLAAIVFVAVLSLVDLATLRHVWRYSRTDALVWVGTFAAALAVSVEAGILVGVAVSLAFYLWRTSQPHMAVVGRVGESEHFRNVLRHHVKTCPHVLAVRVDESLYFANTKSLEDRLLGLVAERPAVAHLLLICSAVNFIDASALETLEHLESELADAGVTFYLAEVKGPVMDRLDRVGFAERLGPERIFLSTHDAMVALDCA